MKNLFALLKGIRIKRNCKNCASVILILSGTLLFAFQKTGWGQTTLYTQNFGTTGSTPTGWTLSNWSINNNVTSTGYSGASGSYNAFIGTTSGTAYLTYNNTTTPLSTVGYTNITVIWGARRYTDDAVPLYFQWSSDGSTWNTLSGWTDVPADAVHLVGQHLHQAFVGEL